MRLGAVFPQAEFSRVDPDEIVAFVQRLEYAGYDHLLVYDHVLGADPDVAWQAQLERVEAALARNDLAGAEMLWSEAYVAAIKSRYWEGMVAAGDSYRRLGELGGFRKLSDAKAREAYLAALFRARSRGSLE